MADCYVFEAIQTTPFFNRTTKMPSLRRVKLFSLLIFLLVITLLFYTASVRQSRTQDQRTVGDFYDKTVNALNSKNKNNVGVGTEDEIIAKKMAESLKDAEKAAKDKANAKAPKPDPPSSVIGVGSAAEGARDDERSVAGRKKFREGGEAQEPVKEKEETEEEHEVEVELNSILKKSPSKTALFMRDVGREANGGNSYHLLEIILSSFKTSKGYLARKIYHRSSTLCRGIGSAPNWFGDTSTPC